MPDQTMIDRYLRARAKAQANGDRSVVRECDAMLRRYGYRPEAPEQAEQRAEAEVKPRRGRPPTRRTA